VVGKKAPSDVLTKDEAKEALKEAVNEWLEKQWAIFGKWSAAGVLSLAIAAMAHATHFSLKGFFER
jgi:hypothetical protein